MKKKSTDSTSFKGTLLVVEDDKPVADLFSSELRKEGYVVDVAANGEEGLVLAKSKKPKLILLDMIMPKIGGREFLSRLRADKSTFTIPVMIVSHLESDYEEAKCRELGIECFIVKHKSTIPLIIEKAKEILKLRS